MGDSNHRTPLMAPKLQTFLKRLLSTVILLAVLAGVLLWHHPYGYALLVCALCNLSTVEWYRMLAEHRRESNRLLILVAGLVYPWLIAWLTLEGAGDSEPEQLAEHGEALPITLFAFKYLLGYVLLAFLFELLRMDYRGLSAREALRSLGTTVVAFVFPVWMFAFALESLIQFPFTVYFLLWLVLATKLSDIFAYASGVLLGGRLIKRPFSPVVSPKKTWEGIIGSFILTALCSWWLLSAMPAGIDMPAHLFFCLFMPGLFVLSVVGDLAGSLIKRGLGVKDSGSLLPGIGGIYDLIDSPAFTISFFTCIFVMFG